MTFCHDRSLGERPHFTTEGLRVDGPKERQPGEYPEWFLKYVQWAQQTKHGILILQLTEAYFKLRAQLSAQCQVDPNCPFGSHPAGTGRLCVQSARGQSPADGSSAM